MTPAACFGPSPCRKKKDFRQAVARLAVRCLVTSQNDPKKEPLSRCAKYRRVPCRRLGVRTGFTLWKSKREHDLRNVRRPTFVADTMRTRTRASHCRGASRPAWRGLDPVLRSIGPERASRARVRATILVNPGICIPRIVGEFQTYPIAAIVAARKSVVLRYGPALHQRG
jgi:hypothetical protein